MGEEFTEDEIKVLKQIAYTLAPRVGEVKGLNAYAILVAVAGASHAIGSPVLMDPPEADE